MTDGLRQGLSVAQRAQARLRLGDDWQLVAAGALLGVVVAFAALAFIIPLHAAERALERAQEFDLRRAARVRQEAS